jgi:hypothetical protein
MFAILVDDKLCNPGEGDEQQESGEELPHKGIVSVQSHQITCNSFSL